MQFPRKLIELLAVTLAWCVAANLVPNSSWQLFDSAQAQTEPITDNSEADKLLQRGVEQTGIGELRDAVDTFQQALAYSKLMRDRDRQEIALSNLAVVYRRLGEYERSLQFYQQSYAIFRNPDILVRLAKFYLSINQRQNALQAYQTALLTYRQSSNIEKEIETLFNIGDVYLLLGQNSQTLQAYQQVLDIYKRKQNCQGEDKTLQQMARVYERIGQNDTARQLYRQVRQQQSDRDRLCLAPTVPLSVSFSPIILRDDDVPPPSPPPPPPIEQNPVSPTQPRRPNRTR